MGLRRPDDAGACNRRNRPGALAPPARAVRRRARGPYQRTTREGRARARTRGDLLARSSEVFGFLQLRERVAQLRPRAVETGLDGRDGEGEALADWLAGAVRVWV